MRLDTTDLDADNLHTNGGNSKLITIKLIIRNHAAASGSMSVCSLCFIDINFFFLKQVPVRSKVHSTYATISCNPTSVLLQGSLGPFFFIITEVYGYLGSVLENLCGFHDLYVDNTLLTIWGSSSRA